MGLLSWRNNRTTSPERKSIFGGKNIISSQKQDYSQYSPEKLFQQFNSENWQMLSDEEKIALFQEIENREAMLHNREPAKVVQAYEESYGRYFNACHIIEIRLTDNQFEDLDTIFHESEHANQYRSPNSEVNFSKDDKKLMLLESTISSDGRTSHYTRYGSLYQIMTSELDANNTALEKVLAEKEQFKDEEKYEFYLTNRQSYYSDLKVIILEKREEKKSALLETAECAYIRNELTEKEYTEIRENIINNSEYDTCEKRALEIDDAFEKAAEQESIKESEQEYPPEKQMLEEESEIWEVSDDQTVLINENPEDSITENPENEGESRVLEDINDSVIKEDNSEELSVMIADLDQAGENEDSQSVDFTNDNSFSADNGMV